MKCFEKKPDRIFTPKEMEKESGMDIKKVRRQLSKLSKEGNIERISRGKYRYLGPAGEETEEEAGRGVEEEAGRGVEEEAGRGVEEEAKKEALEGIGEIEAIPREHVIRYLKTMEKTCEIAIYELMLTESLVGEEDREEIEHQIAYFARHLVRARWQIEKDSLDTVEIDENAFRRAKKIHEWSKFVFDQSVSNNK